jgi:ribosomal protein S18 acetylase RimI-like enzyme
MSIHYASDRGLTVEQFVDVLRRSTLGERRPIDDRATIEAMLRHGNLLCTAWDGDVLVGVARSLTDFAFCCYLSDLAVDQAYQRRGIGQELIRLTRSRLGPGARVILLAAPAAVDYYPRIGFEKHPSAWVASAETQIGRRTAS